MGAVVGFHLALALLNDRWEPFGLYILGNNGKVGGDRLIELFDVAAQLNESVLFRCGALQLD
ncbi:MAG: hypothetical protein AB2672_14410 [Candidatus Thiodiazotropha endolucinida]